jgi:hypothetical protein
MTKMKRKKRRREARMITLPTKWTAMLKKRSMMLTQMIPNMW